MELKKNPEVDGDKIKSSFMMIALNYVAGLSLAAFTFQSVKIEDDLSDTKSRQVSQEFQAEEQEQARWWWHRPARRPLLAPPSASP